jgi:hypothetical protein
MCASGPIPTDIFGNFIHAIRTRKGTNKINSAKEKKLGQRKKNQPTKMITAKEKNLPKKKKSAQE